MSSYYQCTIQTIYHEINAFIILCCFVRPVLAQHKVAKNFTKVNHSMVSGLEYMTTDSNCKLDQIQVFCEDVVCTLVGRESLVETQHCAIGLCLAKCQFNICLKEFFLLQIFKGQDSWQEIFQRLLLYFLFLVCQILTIS